ncbi:MAG: deazaflavin-dependent oxidoreductase (nitroreductase family) [Gammaproteobacteria bacterium]|jgi:deazaflavin-dependent oxidoreductase (nitroreductase family)
MADIDVDDTLRELKTGALPRWIADHLEDYQASNGRQGHLWDATEVGGSQAQPCLLITARGRRSGKLVTHPLLYGVDGDNYLIVGSKGGADTHPSWYFNLLAEPKVIVQIGSDTFEGHATLAEGTEHARLWAAMVRVFPPYTAYQAKTSRQIPIFVIKR